MAAPDYTGEVAAFRAIINGAVDSDLVRYPGEPFTPPLNEDPSDPAIWYDVQFDDLGQLPGEPFQQIAFDNTRARQVVIDIATCVEKCPTADFLARTKMEAFETAFTGQDTGTYLFMVNESAPGEAGTWEEVYHRQDWRLPVWIFH
ncbi:MAG: hypothetical protein KJO44_10900 [Gemmatimonadetes bacterium]|nr:hypothetical protein [Gemmatimonadota bacterium]